MKLVADSTVWLITFLIYTVAGWFMLGVATVALVGFSAKSNPISTSGTGFVEWMLRYERHHPVAWLIMQPAYWWMIFVLGLLFGALAPGFYRRNIMRGRGELDEIRDASVEKEADSDDTEAPVEATDEQMRLFDK